MTETEILKAELACAKREAEVLESAKDDARGELIEQRDRADRLDTLFGETLRQLEKIESANSDPLVDAMVKELMAWLKA